MTKWVDDAIIEGKGFDHFNKLVKEKTLSEKYEEIFKSLKGKDFDPLWIYLRMEDTLKQAIKRLNKRIKLLIGEEKFCMARDKYEEQEIEHINQIEMANKILKLIKEEMGDKLI